MNNITPEEFYKIAKNQESLDTLYKTYLINLCDVIENHPDYSYTKEHCRDVPELARKMILGLIRGAASKEGEAVKRTCKQLGINHTYKAIREFVGN